MPRGPRYSKNDHVSSGNKEIVSPSPAWAEVCVKQLVFRWPDYDRRCFSAVLPLFLGTCAWNRRFLAKWNDDTGKKSKGCVCAFEIRMEIWKFGYETSVISKRTRSSSMTEHHLLGHFNHPFSLSIFMSDACNMRVRLKVNGRKYMYDTWVYV